jgi:tRNA/tmRNA/rRNA uracil-C5-methylase (TrmA/RlmC/RlmD family)
MALKEGTPAPPPAPQPPQANEEDDYVLHEGRPLGTDLSAYLDYAPERYEAILQAKVAALLPAFIPFFAASDAGGVHPEVFRSPARHYRLRIKLGIGVLPTGEAGGKGRGRLTYLMWDAEGRPVPVSDFPVASRRINALMPRLLAALETGPPVLRRGLRAVGFLDTLAGDALVSLMYKVPISDIGDGDGGEGEGEEGPSWAAAARTWLRDALGVQVRVGVWHSVVDGPSIEHNDHHCRRLI